MIYNSFNFILLFPFLFILYYTIPARYQKGRNLYLLATSYLLYVQWKPISILVLLGITIVAYYTAICIGKEKTSKKMLYAGVLLVLAPLLFFKYFNFANDILESILQQLGLKFQLHGLNWFVPIGISFYTFQALGYIWDVYYKKQKAEKNFLTFALFLSFFPSIISGPINKASIIIPQIKKIRPYFDYSKAVDGLKLLLWGMFMKVVVADRIALYVDVVLPNYENYTGITCLIASLLYSIQIYSDFAGYSLMAIGVGKTLGFELTENFRRPYFAYSVTEFWHRWHISLSTWLKDYIYIPLGGSRCGKLKNYWNIFITFLVSGIWHGANWTFIVWGAIHGFCQIIEKMLGEQKCNYGLLGKILKIILTFFIINFAWIFFRMPTLQDAISLVTRIFDVSLPRTIFLPNNSDLLFIIMSIALLFSKDYLDEFKPNISFFNNKKRIIRWTSYMIIFVIIMLTGVFGADQFIYANF